MGIILKGLQRLGVTPVVEDVFRNPNATVSDLVYALNSHLAKVEGAAPVSDASIGSTALHQDEEICVMLECVSPEVADEVIALLEGNASSTAVEVYDVWNTFHDVVGHATGQIIYLRGHGVATAIYHYLFRWVQLEQGKVALTGVLPGVDTTFSLAYETVQLSPTQRPANEVYDRALTTVVSSYLKECPYESYTFDFLRPIASVCSLHTDKECVVDWCVLTLLDTKHSADCVGYLKDCCKNFVWNIFPDIPRENCVNTFARLVQHLVYYQRMINGAPSTRGKEGVGGVSYMSLD